MTVLLSVIAAAALVANAGGNSGFTGVITTGGGRPLVEPVVYASHHGLLNVTLVAAERRVTIAGETVLAKVYNDSFTAPTLVLRPGDIVHLTLVNHLDEPTNLHFHGLEISPSGHADNIFLSIDPGHSFQYRFRLPLDAPTGTFWYHSHEMVPSAQMARFPDTTSEEQVFDGLSGLIEVDGLRADLPPSLRHIAERYIALRDIQIVDGRIVSGSIDSNAPTTRLVDGQLRPRLTIAPGQTQLWHIANIGADIFYRLSLPGHAFDVLAQDGHPVIHADEHATLVLPPGKRYDVLVRGGRRGVATMRTLSFDEGDDHYPAVALAALLTTGRPRISQTPPSVILPHQLNLADVPAARRRVITFAENTAGTRFYVDGQFYDPDRINLHARLNTVEEWTVVNFTDELHVFHLHTYPMQVISVNGVPVAFNGYQDEVDLPPHGYVVIRIHFERYTGVTVFHCHILAHEDMGMMANIEVTR